MTQIEKPLLMGAEGYPGSDAWGLFGCFDLEVIDPGHASARCRAPDGSFDDPFKPDTLRYVAVRVEAGPFQLALDSADDRVFARYELLAGRRCRELNPKCDAQGRPAELGGVATEIARGQSDEPLG